MSSEELEGLRELARIWRRPLEAGTTDRILAYCRLLLEWNARINLTGARSARELVNRHVPDAFAVATCVAPGQRIVDVGTGGGLPALPFALLRPDCPLLLVEPTAKKIAFLRTAVRTLRLPSVSIMPGRIDPDRSPPRPELAWHEDRELTEASPPPEASFEVAMSRATFPLAEWLRLGTTLVPPTGRVLAFATARSKVPPPAGLSLARETPYVLLDGGRRWLREYVRIS